MSRSLAAGGNLLHGEEYEKLVALMGTVQLSEKQVMDHVTASSLPGVTTLTMRQSTTTVSPEDTTLCQLSRGRLSGTGKSKLSQLYAEAIGSTVQNGRYLRLAVRPSWNDDRYLLGYLNTMTGEYVTEPAVDFIIQAEKDRNNLYFFCLDEMDLAHVSTIFRSS